MSDGTDPLTRLVELAVFAPIGVVATARERLPDYVARGRQQVEPRLTLARTLGRLAIEQARRELARRRPGAPAPRGSAAAGPTPAPATPAAARPAPATPAPATPAAPAPDRRGATRTRRTSTGSPTSHELPIDDYESLAASQVVARLAALDDAALDDVEAFELAHRNRRTVLGRIAQLRTAS